MFLYKSNHILQYGNILQYTQRQYAIWHRPILLHPYLIVCWLLQLNDIITYEVFVQRIHSSTLLKGCIIKDAVWDDKGFRFFYGDEHGRVAVANVPRVCPYLYIPLLHLFV